LIENKLKNNSQTKKTITISKKLWFSFFLLFFSLIIFSSANSASALTLADGGWERTATLTIARPSANLTNYPLLITESNLPSEVFDADGTYPAKADGGDIRFSSDQFGVTELAREIVSFSTDNDPANGKAEIWVKVPSVSSSVNTLIYVWYYNPSAGDYLRTDTYGSNNVWVADFKMVHHMNGSSYANLLDSTLNASNITGESGTPNYDQAGKIGKGIDLSSADAEYIYADDSVNYDFGTGRYSIGGWIYFKNVTDCALWMHSDSSSNVHQLYYEASTSTLRYIYIDAGITRADYYRTPQAFNADTWYHLAITRSSNTLNMYVNGSLLTKTTGTALSSTSVNGVGQFQLGRGYFNSTYNYLDGKIDEFRINKGTALAAGWIGADYNNQNNPAAYVTAGTSREALSPDIIAVDAGPSSVDRISLNSDTWFNYSDSGSDNQISFSWTDPNSLSDDIFYYEINTTATNTIDGTELNTTNTYIDSIAISQGISYFHVRPRTTLGTWGEERIFIIKYDTSDPTSGLVSHHEGLVTGAGFGVKTNRGTDTYSGMSANNNDYLLEYRIANYESETCGSYGNWEDTGIIEEATAEEYNFTGEINKCYQFRYTVKDAVGYSATYTSSNTTITSSSPIDANWQRKTKITINHLKVGEGGAYGYPFKVSERYLPYELKQSNGNYPAKPDGSDLRFSSDEAGINLLPFDITKI
jgi:hypothetical protein